MMKLQIQIASFLCATLVMMTTAHSATIPEREVQFRSIDFTTGVIELFNFGILAKISPAGDSVHTMRTKLESIQRLLD